MSRSAPVRSSARRSGSGGTSTSGVNKIIAGTNVTISSTGAGGTGDVTINASGASTVPLSSIIAATGNASVNHTNKQISWAWNSLATGSGLTLSSGAAVTSGVPSIFTVISTGVGTSTGESISANLQNTRTGAGSVNVALLLNASGGDVNYALLAETGLIAASNLGVRIGFSNPGQITLLPPVTGTSQQYHLPDDYPAVNGYILSSSTSGTMSWVAQSGGGGISGLTATRIPFASSPTGIADDAKLYWDNTNKRLSVGEGTAPGYTGCITTSDAATNTVTPVLSIGHATSGTVAVGYGASIIYNMPDDLGFVSPTAELRSYWSTLQHGEDNPSADFKISLCIEGGLPSVGFEQLTLDANGDLTIRATDPTIGGVLSARRVAIRGETSGAITLRAPAVAGSIVYTLPPTDGSNTYVLTTNGSGVLSWAAPGGGGGGGAWSSLTSASGNLTLAQGTNTTTFGYSTALTTTTQNLWGWTVTTSGTAGIGFGGEITTGLQSSTGTTRAAFAKRDVWVTATNAAEVASYRIGLMGITAGAAIPAAGSEQFQFEGWGSFRVIGGTLTHPSLCLGTGNHGFYPTASGGDSVAFGISGTKYAEFSNLGLVVNNGRVFLPYTNSTHPGMCAQGDGETGLQWIGPSDAALVSTGGHVALEWSTVSSATRVGFFGATPVIKQTCTDLATTIAALVAYGLSN